MNHLEWPSGRDFRDMAVSIDDYMKRMMTEQDAVRRAAAGLSDPLWQQRSVLDTISMQDRLLGIDRMQDRLLGIDRASAQITNLSIAERKFRDTLSGTHAIDAARLAGAFKPDLAGISALAASVAGHTKLLAGPLDDLRNFSASAGLASADILALKGAYVGYSDRFRLPGLDEAARLSKVALAAEGVSSRLATAAGMDRAFTTAMQSMNVPWLLRDNVTQSARAFAEIQAIGHGLRSFKPFDSTLTDTLRQSLGDWRDVTALPPSIFDNPIERSEFYVARGFNPDLTDFTAEAFDETTALAGLGPEEDAQYDSDEELGLVRTNRAHDQLQRFERRLRVFVDRLMTAEFGETWIKHQTPPGMLDDWKNAKQAAMARGGEDEPLIAYADFTDYIKIIERSDNWKRVFSAIFDRREGVQESFFRLFPIRIAVAHSRIITLDDEMYLKVETHRISKAIGYGR